MPIYTRRGDGGETSLADGTRVPKTHPRVAACGAIDEANCAVGAARALTTDPLLDAVLAFAQQRLFNCSSRIATPPEARTSATVVVVAADVVALENAADGFEEAAGPLTGFVIPGGSQLAAALQVARATVRRAELSVSAIDAAQEEDGERGDSDVARFLNRLSDTLFNAARYALKIDGIAEEHWDPEAPRPGI